MLSATNPIAMSPSWDAWCGSPVTAQWIAAITLIGLRECGSSFGLISRSSGSGT